jgi:hypothetical protein
MMVNNNLVGGVPTPLKNMSSSVGIIIPNTWENIKKIKPPTRYRIIKRKNTNAVGL